MILVTFILNFDKKVKHFFLKCVFLVFYNFVSVLSGNFITDRFFCFFLLNQTIFFSVGWKFWLMSSGLRSIFSEEFCDFKIFLSICGSFCCQFDIVVLQKKTLWCSKETQMKIYFSFGLFFINVMASTLWFLKMFREHFYFLCFFCSRRSL